jgi:hypothetical protein
MADTVKRGEMTREMPIGTDKLPPAVICASEAREAVRLWGSMVMPHWTRFGVVCEVMPHWTRFGVVCEIEEDVEWNVLI